ncbi:AcrR family transcriptional regulator [Lysobacter niastensis]|uniref:AcrR family transcriptional regulator n=1 Tax=Lysobacter niastensis TaxID=380629 RepID=A0ABU1WBS9_9GAMM|nr:TetR/AcrR family transcriptional regulator [Lysobacter niastensis]MDR7135028.1 AcrR family transcriptional regulator [Lysobacter niastensis]
MADQPRPPLNVRYRPEADAGALCRRATKAGDGGELASDAQIKYDAHHMRQAANKSKEATHDRIVDAAARAIRRSGYNGTGVADIMKAAGLTHGGFYAHFPSREAMLAEAADRAGREAVEMMQGIAATTQPDKTLQAMAHAYLSKEHLESVETGCATAALGSEMPRQAPEVRRAATRRIKEMIDLVSRHMPDWGQPDAHERALATVSTMVGTLVLARAVDDPRLSDALREAALNHLFPTQD